MRSLLLISALTAVALDGVHPDTAYVEERELVIESECTLEMERVAFEIVRDGSFVAVAASPLETSFKGFFAFDASRVARRLVATMALPVPLPSPPSRAPKTLVPLDDSPRVSR